MVKYIFSQKLILLKKITIHLLTLTFLLQAQNIKDNQTDSQFKQAITLFESSKFNDALKIFDNLSDDKNLNSKTTAAHLFKGKTQLELKRFGEAKNTLHSFIEKYPSSSYLDEARLTLAKALVEMKEYEESFLKLITLIKNTEDGFYDNYARVTAKKLAVNYLSSSKIKAVSDTISGEKIKPYVLLVLAEVYNEENNLSNVDKIVSDIIQKFPKSKERNDAELLRKKIKDKEKQLHSSPLIGVILPLEGDSISNEAKSSANEVLEGIKYAVSEFNDGHENKIGLVIRNTGMNEDRMVQIKDEFQSIPSLRSIIGPLFSTEAREALAIFRDTGIPIISPTATDNDLTQLNEYFFQANPPFGIRGKIMAQYIYYVENKRRMAVLNAIEGYSPLLASTFKEEFEKLGGEIVVSETYKSGGYSLNEPVKKISEFSGRVDGIYIPLADKIDAPVIISQLVQNNMDVFIYGDQDWMLASGYQTSPSLSNKIIFSSDYFIDFNNDDFREFNKNFFAQTNLDVNRNILYGYDTAKYLLTVLRNIFSDRSAVVQKMSSGLISTGYHNNITFDKNRVNKFLNIVRYRDGKFELVDKFKGQ